MNYLFENQSISLLSELPIYKIVNGNIFSPIAFFYEPKAEDLEESKTELLNKIITSIGQTTDNTLLLNLKKFRFTLNDFQTHGISKVVLFSDHKVSQFSSISYKIDSPFLLSGINIYATASLTTLQSQPDLKKKLWAFLKS